MSGSILRQTTLGPRSPSVIASNAIEGILVGKDEQPANRSGQPRLTGSQQLRCFQHRRKLFRDGDVAQHPEIERSVADTIIADDAQWVRKQNLGS